MKEIEILELFGGIGAPRKALENLGYNVNSDYIEIDKHAVKSYNAIFNESNKPMSVTEFTTTKKYDILFHGSPCQDFSVAGNLKGGEKGSGTRSSLMWETVRIIEECMPKVVIWENVKNAIGKKNIDNFNRYIYKLDSLGYNTNFKVLNAKDFGIPHGRERVFAVSLLKGEFNFQNLKQREMKDISKFIDFDDFKNALDNERIERIKNWNAFEKPLDKLIDETTKILPTLTTRGNLAMTSSIKLIKTNYLVDYGEKGEFLKVKQATKKGYIECDLKSVVDLSYPKSNTRRGRVQENGKITPTLTATTNLSVVNAPLIRPITAKECFKLMGFTEEDYNKASLVCSDSQIAKQAGNSIVVSVLEALFECLLNNKSESKLIELPKYQEQIELELYFKYEIYSYDDWHTQNAKERLSDKEERDFFRGIINKHGFDMKKIIDDYYQFKKQHIMFSIVKTMYEIEYNTKIEYDPKW